MDDLGSAERQIQAEVERLRSQFADTQELYREVCVLLFFRFGITPTANKLYQFVRKGSMSAPAEALSRFWGDLRAKSKVRIEHPDLPDELRESAGQLVATLWSKAQTQAQDSLAAFRSEAATKVAESKACVESANQTTADLKTQLEAAKDLIAQSNQTIHDQNSQLAAEQAKLAALTEQLGAATENQAVLQRSVEAARKDFAAELEKQRTALAHAEERLQATEKHALLEIDKERSALKRIEKELDAARLSANQASVMAKGEIAALQAQLGTLHQQVGSLDGQLQAALAQRNALVTETENLRETLTNRANSESAAQAEAELWRQRALGAEEKLAELHASKSRKTKTRAERTSSPDLLDR
jgi:chromosome segregation ATPase